MGQAAIYIVTTREKIRRWAELDARERTLSATGSRDVEDIWRQQDKLEETLSLKFELDSICGTEVGLLLTVIDKGTKVFKVEELSSGGDSEDGPHWLRINDDVVNHLARANFPKGTTREWSDMIFEFHTLRLEAHKLERALALLQKACRRALEREESLFYLLKQE